MDDPVNKNDPTGLDTQCDENGNNCYDSVTVVGDPDDDQLFVDTAQSAITDLEWKSSCQSLFMNSSGNFLTDGSTGQALVPQQVLSVLMNGVLTGTNTGYGTVTMVNQGDNGNAAETQGVGLTVGSSGSYYSRSTSR